MTTSAIMSLKSVSCLDDETISPFAMGYVKAAARDESYEVVLQTFLNETKIDSRITRAFMARRCGKTPEQITRYLGSPGNWTMETFALLLASIGYKPTFGAEKISERRWDNECHALAVDTTANFDRNLKEQCLLDQCGFTRVDMVASYPENNISIALECKNIIEKTHSSIKSSEIANSIKLFQANIVEPQMYVFNAQRAEQVG